MRNQRFSRGRLGWAIAGAVLLIGLGLVSTQAYAASVSVTAQPIQNAGPSGAIDYSSDWSGVGGGSTSSPTFGATADTYVAQDKATNNYGSDTTLNVRSWGTKNQRALVQFDVSSIPAGATIDSATLTLCVTTGPSGGRIHEVHRVTATWAEGSVTWDTQPSVAASATGSVTVPASSGCVTWTVTPDVQGWVDGTTNYGWRIADSVEGSSAKKLTVSRSLEDTSTPSEQPKLDVTYTTSGMTMRHESSIVTLDVSDQVTSVTIDGSKDAHAGTVNITVNLLDAGGATVDTGFATLPAAGEPYSVVVSMTLGSIAYTGIATVQVIYVDA